MYFVPPHGMQVLTLRLAMLIRFIATFISVWPGNASTIQ
jgi:hypothetical protein